MINAQTESALSNRVASSPRENKISIRVQPKPDKYNFGYLRFPIAGHLTRLTSYDQSITSRFQPIITRDFKDGGQRRGRKWKAGLACEEN